MRAAVGLKRLMDCPQFNHWMNHTHLEVIEYIIDTKANSVGQDETLKNVKFHKGLHCLTVRYISYVDVMNIKCM